MKQNIIDALLRLLKKRKLLFIGLNFITISIVVLLLAMDYMFQVSRTMASGIKIGFDKNKDQQYVYPSGKIFNPIDIINDSVLLEIYQQNKLTEKLPFDQFKQLIQINSFKPENYFVIANFAQKLKGKALSAVDLKAIEQQYTEELANVDDSKYLIKIIYNEKNSPISNLEYEKILTQIPEVWVEIFKRREGRQMLQIQHEDITSQAKKLLSIGQLNAIDYLVITMKQLKNNLATIQRGMRDRIITTEDGDTVDSLIKEINLLAQYNMSVIQNIFLLENGSKLNSYDQLYVAARIETLIRERNIIENELCNISEALSIIDTEIKGKVDKENIVSSGGNSQPQMMLDTNMFNQIAKMAKANQMLDLRKEYANMRLQKGSNLAEIDSDLVFYNRLLEASKKAVNGAAKQEFSSESFEKIFIKSAEKLQSILDKTIQLQEIYRQEINASYIYYSPISTQYILKEYFVPFNIAVLVGVILLLAVNGITLGAFMLKELAQVDK